MSILMPMPKARAVTLGDAALTVAISTAAGAVLGASTLPFYENSAENTKNIFYGAAIGAVVGVFVTAYMGVQQGADDEDETFARLRRESTPAAAENWTLGAKLHAPSSNSLAKVGKADPVLAWTQVVQISF